MRIWQHHRFLTILFILIVSLTLPLSAQADHGGQTSDKEQQFLEGVGYDQKLDAQVPADLTFVNEAGQTVQFADFLGDKPIVLVMAYYECPMLCTLVLNGLLNGLDELDFDIGSEFEVVTVSIDPHETPEMAVAKKDTYIQFYGRPGAAEGWHFLTTDETNINRLTETIGFRYQYDEKSDEYAHPTGMIVLTPEGRISRYFFGIEFNSTDLRLGLVEASTHKIGSAIDQLLLMCYQYDPETGQYTPIIMNIIQIVGLTTVGLILIPIVTTIYRSRRMNPAV